MRIHLAYSPCPNDTALFGPIACGDLALPGGRLTTHLHDIETLNRHAQTGRYHITKLSVAGYLQSRDRYRLLDVGAALGFGCGPLLVSAPGRCPEDLAKCRILFPGRRTTAYLLFRLLVPESPPARHGFAPYNEIAPAVAAGAFDCGVIIHETRFTYERQGLERRLDLGQAWEALTGLPVPLGCCAIRRDLEPSLAGEFTRLVRRGLDRGGARAGRLAGYIRRHATELEPDVIDRHIRLYLNDHTRDLGETGRRAIEALARRAESAGLLNGAARGPA